MKKFVVLISIFLLVIPVVALAKSGNGDGSKATTEERAKRVKERAKQAKESCEAELKVVGEDNFKELYGKGDDRTGATSQCQKIKKSPPRHGKRGKRGKGQNGQGQRGPGQRGPNQNGQNQDYQGQPGDSDQNNDRGQSGQRGQRGGPPGGPLGKCLKESGTDRDSSSEDKKAAVKKCKAEHKKKRAEMESKRLAVLKSCVDEQSDDQSAFNTKYTLVGEENQAKHKKRLEQRKAKLAEAGKSTTRVDKQLKRLDTADVRPFRACDRSNMKKVIEKERGSRDGDNGPGSRGGPGGPGQRGSSGSGGPDESSNDGFGGPPPEQI